MTGFRSLEQIVSTLQARWRLAAIVGGCILAAAIFATAVTRPVYQADATLIFNARSADAIVDKTDGGYTFANYLASEVDLIRSRRVIERAAKDQAFQRLPAVVAAYRRDGGARPIDRWLTGFVTRNLIVTAAKNSRAVTVSASAGDADFAAAIANSVAGAYLATNVDLRTSPALQNREFFAQQKKARYDELVAAQARFDGFLRQTGMTGLEAKSDVDDLQLRTLSAALTEAQADRARASAEGGLPNAAAAVSAGLIDNSVVQRLRGDIADQAAALKDLSVLRGPNHPQVLQAQARLREMNDQLDAETAKIAQGLRRRIASATGREAQILALERGQRAELTTSAANRSRLAVFASDVDRAKAAYDAVSQRLDDMSLTGALDLPNASILSAAVPPNFPSSPSWGFNLLVGLIAGVIGGGLAALGAELLRPLVRTRADLEMALAGAPILAEMRV